MIGIIKLTLALITLAIPALIVFVRARGAGIRERLIRAIIAIIAGYVVLNVATNVSWDLSFRLAQSQAEQDQICNHDGAPRVFALLFGWIPMTCYVGLLVGIDTVMRVLRRRKETKNAQAGRRD
jgi:hypothetical protein